MDFTSDSSSIDVSLRAPSRARAGEHVAIGIVLRNGRAQTTGLATAGRGITFDIVVSRGETLVWQRLSGQTVPMSLEIRMLQPGESIELKDGWHATVTPGTYTLVGRILTDAEPLETPPVEIEIVGI